ncbi:hypothetical protein RFI_21449, partial [Reticulomyxa filosa]
MTRIAQYFEDLLRAQSVYPDRVQAIIAIIIFPLVLAGMCYLCLSIIHHIWFSGMKGKVKGINRLLFMGNVLFNTLFVILQFCNYFLTLFLNHGYLLPCFFRQSNVFCLFLGRLCLYMFFLKRLHSTLEGSALSYSPNFVKGVSIALIIWSIGGSLYYYFIIVWHNCDPQWRLTASAPNGAVDFFICHLFAVSIDSKNIHCLEEKKKTQRNTNMFIELYRGDHVVVVVCFFFFGKEGKKITYIKKKKKMQKA